MIIIDQWQNNVTRGGIAWGFNRIITGGCREKKEVHLYGMEAEYRLTRSSRRIRIIKVIIDNSA